jgi:hypothetical protein
MTSPSIEEILKKSHQDQTEIFTLIRKALMNRMVTHEEWAQGWYNWAKKKEEDK